MKSEASVKHPKEELETKMLRKTQYSGKKSNFYNIAVDYNKESFSNQVYFFLMNIYSSPQDFSALIFSFLQKPAGNNTEVYSKQTLILQTLYYCNIHC